MDSMSLSDKESNREEGIAIARTSSVNVFMFSLLMAFIYFLNSRSIEAAAKRALQSNSPAEL
jgi:hypothetical protein